MPNKMIEEMVRDFTTVVPRPKSEVRRKLQEYRLSTIKECMECAPKEKDYSGCEMEPTLGECMAIKDYNQALSDFKQIITNLMKK